ncbi:SDR family NAD(P)-dependent oxidoreductase [Phytohabitans suffuscus]|uniref:Short-chain dehydrogenase n=1 Tax=Phytohabitans suffuscus TaxID=624315 RepID=A0A6F8YG60_9ACTN|nr:SDR family oxidoreductase [Phytohabitans suffuscus]BCB84958.1 short-chain dehydrogenase [Phytohabitans suffuscus]
MSVVVVGGSAGIGLEVARFFADLGDDVLLTSRDAGRAERVAKEVGARGVALDLAEPETIAGALTGVERVDHLVLAAIERDHNTAAEYAIERAIRLVTLKLVGYTEVVHALVPKMHPGSSIVVFGGQAMQRPYPGSTTVSTVNGGVVGLVHTLACELAPIRVNGIHPGIVGDSPYWEGKPLDAVVARTPLGRLAVMNEVRDAVVFLLRNGAINGVNLPVDGGWLLK